MPVQEVRLKFLWIVLLDWFLFIIGCFSHPRWSCSYQVVLHRISMWYNSLITELYYIYIISISQFDTLRSKIVLVDSILSSLESFLSYLHPLPKFKLFSIIQITTPFSTISFITNNPRLFYSYRITMIFVLNYIQSSFPQVFYSVIHTHIKVPISDSFILAFRTFILCILTLRTSLSSGLEYHALHSNRSRESLIARPIPVRWIRFNEVAVSCHEKHVRHARSVNREQHIRSDHLLDSLIDR